MNLKTRIKHSIKMAIAALIRFVVNHPKLLAACLLIAGSIPPLKRRLTHIHLSTNLSAVQNQVWVAPQDVPLPARSVYLQLIAGRREH